MKRFSMCCAPMALLAAGCAHASVPAETASAIDGAAEVNTVSPTEIEARRKITRLERLMQQARTRNIDVKREETLLWFSKEFLKFANWDEANRDQIEQLFGYYRTYFAEQKERYANELPEFERNEVGTMLDAGIAKLEKVLAGEIVRPKVNPVDWQNANVGDNAVFSGGRPIFLYDYFSKTVGAPLTDKRIYNDHLGAIFHGGENLYPVNHDRAINTYLLREDGTYDPELLKEVTDISPTNIGFLYFWNMGVPDWMVEREPQIGKSRSLFTGFDIDNPLAREVWGKIARDMGDLTKGKKVSELGFVLSNEPHYFVEKDHWTNRYGEMLDISTYTWAHFQRWLERKYDGDLAALNANWNSRHASFEAIQLDLPLNKSQQGTPVWYDFMRFNMDRTTDWFTFLQGELHKGNPDADTSIKVMTHLWTHDPRTHGLDFEALTELTTMIGDDARAIGARSVRTPDTPASWEDRYAYEWTDLGMGYDFVESVAPGKVHFNSEAHMLSASTWRQLDTPPEYVRSTYWFATLQGMDISTSWFWARDPDGSPEDRLEGTLDFFDGALAGSYAGSVNMQPRVANEKTQTYLDMNAVAEQIIALREQKRALRIFYSETSAISAPDYMSGLTDLHEELFFDGMPVGFATKNIIDKQDHDQWDAILVYQSPRVTDAEFASLQSYLDAGGTVIIDGANSLSKNEYGVKRETALKANAGKLVTVDGTSSPAAMRTAGMKEITQPVPVMLEETNAQGERGVIWRVVANGRGGQTVNVMNLGRDKAMVTMTLRSGDGLSATNMETGEAVPATFDLPKLGVLLLDVSPS